MAIFKKVNGQLTRVNDFAQELEAGIKVEMEHTTVQETAEKIARDHLAEDENYYSKLTEAGL